MFIVPISYSIKTARSNDKRSEGPNGKPPICKCDITNYNRPISILHYRLYSFMSRGVRIVFECVEIVSCVEKSVNILIIRNGCNNRASRRHVLLNDSVSLTKCFQMIVYGRPKLQEKGNKCVKTGGLLINIVYK